MSADTAAIDRQAQEARKRLAPFFTAVRDGMGPVRAGYQADQRRDQAPENEDGARATQPLGGGGAAGDLAQPGPRTRLDGTPHRN